MRSLDAPDAASTDWWIHERAALARGHRRIAGIDEAGRGALAGPVIAACVILEPERTPVGVADSKALTARQRDLVFGRILQSAAGMAIGRIEPEVIDEVNILRATHQAMRLALRSMPPQSAPDLALIDGLPVHPFDIAHVAIVRGDACSASIAAASIVAKVTRDRIMRVYEGAYPGYGFARHKGYGTPEHLRALTELGPCPLHRRTFRPVTDRARPALSLCG